MGDQTVLITGASRGIGLALSERFLELGFTVIATYRGNNVPASLQALTNNERLRLLKLEVTESDEIKQVAQTLIGTVIDILINNAGVIGPEEQSRRIDDTQGWLDTFAINTIAPLMLSNALLANLLLSTNPRILTISSQMGALSGTSTGMFAYRSSKAAVNKVMQVLAIELSDLGIKVCCVHPGWVQTDMGGAAADISVQQSAKGIAQLACQLTTSQSGQFINWQGEPLTW